MPVRNHPRPGRFRMSNSDKGLLSAALFIILVTALATATIGLLNWLA